MNSLIMFVVMMSVYYANHTKQTYSYSVQKVQYFLKLNLVLFTYINQCA
jgi:hypothetical protein